MHTAVEEYTPIASEAAPHVRNYRDGLDTAMKKKTGLTFPDRVVFFYSRRRHCQPDGKSPMGLVSPQQKLLEFFSAISGLSSVGNSRHVMNILANQSYPCHSTRRSYFFIYW